MTSLEDLKKPQRQIHFLIITEAAEATDQKGAINFVNKGSKLAFELSVSALDDANIKFSSTLTKMAKKVY